MAMWYFDLVNLAEISSVFGEVIEYVILFGEVINGEMLCF